MKEKNFMNSNTGRLEVVLVLPVFTHHISFLTIINAHCAELVRKMPGVHWTIMIINDGSRAIPSETQLLQSFSAPVTYYYYHLKYNLGKGVVVRFGQQKAPVVDMYIYTNYDFPFGVKAC